MQKQSFTVEVVKKCQSRVTPIWTQDLHLQWVAACLDGSENLSKHLSDTFGDTFLATKRRILFIQTTRSLGKADTMIRR